MKDIVNAIIEAEEFITAAMLSKSPKRLEFVETSIGHWHEVITRAEAAGVDWMKTHLVSNEAIAERAMLRKERMDAAKEGRRVTERREAEKALAMQESVTVAVGAFEDDFGIFA